MSTTQDQELLNAIGYYYKSRLRRAGFFYNPRLPDPPVDLMVVVSETCKLYEEAYRANFSEIQTYGVRIDAPSVLEDFNEVGDGTFGDGIYNWGRIIGLICYGSMLALQAASLNKPELVNTAVKIVHDYLQKTEIKEFRAKEGGWPAFVRLYDKREPATGSNTLVTVGLTAVAAAAGIFLASRFFQRGP